MKLNNHAQLFLATQQIRMHNGFVLNVEGNPAFQVLAPPPSSFGGFSAILVVALFFGCIEMRGLSV